MNMRLFLLPLLLSVTALRAQDAPSGEAAVDPRMGETVRDKVGQTITIEGTPVKVGANKSGSVCYINFTPNYKDSISIACFVSKSPNDFTKEKLGEWVGKKIRVTGKLADFNGALQISVDKPDQIVAVP